MPIPYPTLTTLDEILGTSLGGLFDGTDRPEEPLARPEESDAVEAVSVFYIESARAPRALTNRRPAK